MLGTSSLIQNICQEISTYAVFVAQYILAVRLQYFRTHTHERVSAFLTARVVARKYLVHVAMFNLSGQSYFCFLLPRPILIHLAY